jgi:hypothetical protein
LDFPAPFSQQAQLEQIRDSIQQQGSINAASVGSKLALQVDLAFHSGNVSVGYINATLTDTSLVGASPSRPCPYALSSNLSSGPPSESRRVFFVVVGWSNQLTSVHSHW